LIIFGRETLVEFGGCAISINIPNFGKAYYWKVLEIGVVLNFVGYAYLYLLALGPFGPAMAGDR